MSMVNCMTLNSTSRVVLTSYRNAFTMVANLGLYAIAFVVFSATKGNTQVDVENQVYYYLFKLILPVNFFWNEQYRWIAYISIFIGAGFVGMFQFGTKEPRLKIGLGGNNDARISWTYWFKKVLNYQVAIVYMLTRLVQNVSQAYLAFYVIDELGIANSAKALGSSCSSTEILDKDTGNPYLSITRIGLGLVPALCSLVGVAITITYTMKLDTSYSKALVEPLLV
ncbi:hypothetical protein Dsin_000005 [Dipteronia sinensis]|uniref:Uncharacterized protein n=1 Tax=Dipteronia sinensis TaxID=43782 RepID=A0AAD9Z409_9ROSI|nr:hypothetical protein Dsin_000005 [Dipteronia sinensis]